MALELGETILPINWWLIYGHPRSGTSYLTRMIARCAKRRIGDWGLRKILIPIVKNPSRRFDNRRFLADFAVSLLENSLSGGSGNQLELVFKQAGLKRDEYDVLVQMWGKPARIICCFRDPAGTINSHQHHKKFSHHLLETVQAQYVEQVQRYKSIGGELFEYQELLTVDDYRNFLRPLILPDELRPFVYKGNKDKAHVTPPMEEAYEQMCQLMALQSRTLEKRLLYNRMTNE